MPGHDDITDAQLVERVRSGDDAAFEAIVHRYHAPLLTYIVNKLRSRDVADDIIQELFLRLWRSRASLDPASNIRAYLYTSVRNQIYDHLRRERASQSLFDVSDDVDAGDPEDADILADIDRRDLENALADAIGKLPGRCREVWTLSRDHGLGYEEIASVMGVSLNTVKTQMGRAMRVLRVVAKPFR